MKVNENATKNTKKELPKSVAPTNNGVSGLDKVMNAIRHIARPEKGGSFGRFLKK